MELPNNTAVAGKVKDYQGTYSTTTKVAGKASIVSLKRGARWMLSYRKALMAYMNIFIFAILFICLSIWHIIFIANIVRCTSVEISYAFRQEQQWQAAFLCFRSVCHTLTQFTRCNIYCTGLLESATKQWRKGNYKEAEQHAMQVLQQEPNNADAMSRLSAIHGDCGRWDKAKYFGQKAIEQDPRHAGAHCNLGDAHYNSDQVQKAVTHYKKSLEVG